MKGRRVFVTGGAGVIGLELIPRLVAAGAEVLVGDLKPRPESFPPDVLYRQGDLNDMTRPELEAFAPEILIHLAATFERSTETFGFWDENFRHNVALSHHLMTLARGATSLKRVVFASSYLIYDPVLYQFDAPQEAPVALTEEDPLRPRNLTGMAKLSHEMELEFLAGFEETRFSTLAVRIFRGYGRNSRDVISRWVRALLADDPITVFRPEGTFDYIYAADSAEGLLRLAEADHVTGHVNLGTGRSRRVQDVVDILLRHFPSAKVETAASEIPYEMSQADITRLRALTNWAPAYDLEDAIAEIIDHERAAQRGGPVAAERPRNVLVTSAARKAPLLRAMQDAARRVAAEARVIAGDLDPEAPARHVADGFWAIPRTEAAAVDDLVAGCRERGIGAVLPTRDGELLFWARNREVFAEAGIEVIVSPPEAVMRCLDKLAFARFGAEAGLPVIAAAETPEALPGGPLVVKERFGAGSQAIGLDLSADAARAHAERLDAPIFQPFLAGPEISIDGWLDAGGRAAGVVLRRRDRVIGGESQVTTTFRDPELEADACAILERLGLRGPVVMQAILTSDGMRIIEVNPRFGGASTLAIAAGLDTLHWSLREAFGDTTAPVFRRVDGPLRQVRLPADLVLHDPDL